MLEAVFAQSWAATNEGGVIQWNEDEPEDAAKVGALGLVQMYLRDTPTRSMSARKQSR
jgi:hypothetical protein